MQYTYTPQGVCSMKMIFEIEDNIVKKLQIIGGCPGNTVGVSRLVENRTVDEVIEILKKSTDLCDMCVDFLMIAKYFERIGDHAENICEWVEFNETGEYKNSRIL